MKKRKIFISLALASACVFSLAACGKKQADPTVTPTVEESKPAESKPAESTPAQNDASSSVENTTPSENQQAEPTEGQNENQGGNETPSEGEVVEATYKLTYNANGHGVAPQEVSNVKALPATLPTIEVEDGYELVGWATSSDATEANVTAGAALEADTELFAVWKEEETNYGRLARLDEKIIATKFGSGSVGDYDHDENSWKAGDVGFYNANKYDENDALIAGINVSVVDGKLVLTDDSTTETTTAKAELGFLYDGVVEGTMKYTPTNKENKVNGGWSWVQFCGYKDYRSAESTLFAIRTNSDKKAQVYFTSECTKDTNNKTQYDLKGTEFTYEAGKEYEIYWKYDFENAKLTVKINGTAVVEDCDVPQADQPVFLTTLKFITATDEKRGVKLDDFAVANTNVKSVEDTKTYFKSFVESVYNSMDLDNVYSFDKDDITAAYNETIAEIESATSREEAFDAFMVSKVASATSDADQKSLVVAAIDDFNTDNSGLYTLNATDFAQAIATAKENANNATSKDALTSAYLGLITSMYSIKSDEMIRAEAKLELAQYYATKIALISEEDRVAATAALASVYANYNGTEDTKGELDNAEPQNIASVLAAGKQEIDDAAAYYLMTLAEYKDQLNASYEIYKNAQLENYDETADPDLFTQVGSLAIDYTDVDTKAKAQEAFNSAKPKVQETIDAYFLNKEIAKAEADLDAYVAQEVAKLAIKDHYANSSFEASVNTLVTEEKEAIEAVTEIENVAAALEVSKAKVDEIMASIKAETEIETTIMFGNQVVNKFVAIKNGTLSETELTEQASGTYLGLTTTFDIEGFYKNADLDAAWDYANDVVTSDNNTIYIKGKVVKYEYVPTNEGITFNGTVAQAGMFKITAKKDSDLDDGYFNFGGSAATIEFTLNGKAKVNFSVEAESTSTNKDGYGLTIKKGSTRIDENEVQKLTEAPATPVAYNFETSTLLENATNQFTIARLGGGGIKLTKLTIDLTYEFTVEYDDMNDATTENVVRKVAVGGIAESITPEANGTKTFVAWYTSDDNGQTLNAPFDFTTPITSDVKLYAYWDDATYNKVTFKDGIEVYTVVNVKDGETITDTNKPSDPTKDGYKFVGWFTSTDGGTTLSDTEFAFSTAITGDITLYAKWEEKQAAKRTYSFGENLPKVDKMANGVAKTGSVEVADATTGDKLTLTIENHFTGGSVQWSNGKYINRKGASASEYVSFKFETNGTGKVIIEGIETQGDAKKVTIEFYKNGELVSSETSAIRNGKREFTLSEADDYEIRFCGDSTQGSNITFSSFVIEDTYK